MANKYAGTKTEKNLWEAFAGESMARNKYTFFTIDSPVFVSWWKVESCM